MKMVREELSVEYGFCSPESSLLMLYSIEQFIDNDVLPPKGHPTYNDKKAPEERMKQEELRKSVVENNREKQIAKGEVGGLKNKGQLEQVANLARKLEAYLSEPTANKIERNKSDCHDLVGSPRRMRMLSRQACANTRYLGGCAAPPHGNDSFEEEPQAMRFSGGCWAESESMEEEEKEEEAEAGWDLFGMPSDQDADRDSCEDEAAVLVNAELDGEGLRELPGMDQSLIAPPKEPESYQNIEKVLKNTKLPANLWKKSYQLEKGQQSKGGATISPSFYLTCARLALNYDKDLDAIRIATNCLEAGIDDVQLIRCVVYFLLSTKCLEGTEFALRLFNKVQELQPCEPQSYLDCALAKFWQLNDDTNNTELKESIKVIQGLIARILTHRWADRFNEIEWPALILLHYVADFVNDTNKKRNLVGTQGALPVWPVSELSQFRTQIATVSCPSGNDPLRCSGFDLALMVWMGWDSDYTDVDLHVVEPTMNEVYYGNKNSTVGGHLSLDFKKGYGPKIYILKRPKKNARGEGCNGNYDIYAKYYASHQDSLLTGATSVLLWTIEKKSEESDNEVEFLNIRLDTKKQKTKVKSIQLMDAQGRSSR
uniref:Uncharacterized protein n=1 Tax=Odontella aurita TaxID=265563 RepID=A0A7S4J0A2_9STRA|mmetsp:Transcript_34574/g.103319  ORF Transcript_34574/g.103319 Transcript_34574/m.103319 type:complete len:599 (+) Transcript_34574:1999-3795(+)